MTNLHNALRRAWRVVRAAVFATSTFMLAMSAAPQVLQAQDSLGTKDKANALVEAARISLDRVLSNQSSDNLKRYLDNARAVLIVPELIKGGFIVGAEGGTGVLLVRGADGTWSAPASSIKSNWAWKTQEL